MDIGLWGTWSGVSIELYLRRGWHKLARARAYEGMLMDA